jgi:hypothetical protein
MHTIQQLQLELADARGRSGSYTDESHLSQSNPKDVSSFSQNNGRQLDVNGTTASNANNGALQNGNADNALSFASTVNVPNQVGFLVTMFYFSPINLNIYHPVLFQVINANCKYDISSILRHCWSAAIQYMPHCVTSYSLFPSHSCLHYSSLVLSLSSLSGSWFHTIPLELRSEVIPIVIRAIKRIHTIEKI